MSLMFLAFIALICLCPAVKAEGNVAHPDYGTAAALANGLDRKGPETKVLVYDLGGGTFDASLLSIKDGVFEVLATAGDTHLGGEAFDNRVIDYLVRVYETRTGTDVSRNQRTMEKLKKAVEGAKHTLSTLQSARVEIKAFEGGNDFLETLTRAKFEELNVDLFRKTLEPVAQVLRDAKVGKHEVDEIVLVGGSARIPKVQELLEEYFGKKPFKGINPDEAIAYGAAVQGGNLSGASIGSILLRDANPFTFAMGASGGVSRPLINRNALIPARKGPIYATLTDDQQTVLIHISEDERGETTHNNPLGKFELSGMAPAPEGVPQIEEIVNVGANDIMHITASDKETSKIESIEITKGKRLSKEDVARMVEENEHFVVHGGPDRKRVEALNYLSSYVSKLKGYLADREGLWGGLDEKSIKILFNTIKDGMQWIEERGQTASLKDLEEKLAGECEPFQALSSTDSGPDIEGTVYQVVLKASAYSSTGSRADDEL